GALMGAGIVASAVFGGGVLYLAAGRPAKTALGKNSFALWGSLLFLLGLTVRLVLGYSQTGYQIDMDTFKSWARIVNEVGFSQIYRQDIFLDYPPGYLYVLWALERLRLALGLDAASQAFTLLM